MKLAVLFSGQGSQKSGMGIDFLADPLFKKTIEEASEASGQDLVQVFKSEHGELDQTLHVQPALVSFEVGIYKMLVRDLAIKPQAMIGLSLGEYGAILASGALSLSDGIKLVADRASYMQEDADQVESGMLALVKPDLAKCQAIVEKLTAQNLAVYISNYNSPKQVVLGGQKNAVKQAAQAIKEEAGAKRVVELAVNGAFHTPLFDQASQKMATRLQAVEFKPSICPVYSNTTCQVFDEKINQTLAEQVNHPTHFGECVQNAVNDQAIDTTLEIGPGKTLTSFAHQVDRSLNTYRIGSFTEYQTFIEEAHGITR